MSAAAEGGPWDMPELAQAWPVLEQRLQHKAAQLVGSRAMLLLQWLHCRLGQDKLWETLRSHPKPNAYLNHELHNLALALLRGQPGPGSRPSPSLKQEMEASYACFPERWLSCVRKLAAAEQRAYSLLWANYQPQDIAAQLREDPATVGNRIHQAHEQVQKCLGVAG